MSDLCVVILAAGLGTRMKSAIPKVLHPLGGRPFLYHVLEAAASLKPAKVIVVIGHGAEQVKEAVQSFELKALLKIEFVEQLERLGTGHAVKVALDAIVGERLLVMYGDVPLISKQTYQQLLMLAPTSLGVLTANVENPFGLGRIIRDAEGKILRIIEEKDANLSERAVCEVNTGIFVIPVDKIKKWANNFSNDNAQKEYYLTDIVKMAVDEGVKVMSHNPKDVAEVQGINDRAQQAAAERDYQLMQARSLQEQGVLIVDPNRFDVRGTIEAGHDVLIDVNVVFEGTNKLGHGVKIGPFCFIKDCILGEGVEVLPHSHLDGVIAAKGCTIGPFARCRPGTELSDQVKIGNFVETKKATVGKKSKISHLSYIGDATIGQSVNIGAGTITCNYDGVNKYQTVIEDDAFIGSDTQLVAPVTVGKGATIGAGTTLTRDAPAEQLTLSRGIQKTIPNWRRPRELLDDKIKH